MKKIAFLFVALMWCACGDCFAQSQNPQSILIIKIKGQGVSHPKNPGQTENVTMSAEYDSSDLYFSISGYTGEVDLFVTNSQNTSMDSDILNVVASASTSFDISAYPAGTYHLYIYLDDGSIYEGEFEIE
jgi:hypothetical protein